MSKIERRTRSLPWTALAMTAALTGGCAASDPGSEMTEQRSEGLFPAPPDATGLGPLATTSSEYHLPPAIDNSVIQMRQTEIWAAVTRPAALSGGPFPVVIMLHGNHPTCGDTNFPRTDGSCEYSTTGVCSPPFPVITPNHLGYTYLADRLASWGYIVVQPNVNMGINCAPSAPGDPGLNLARGRMILRHLEVLSAWNQSPGTTPASLGVDLAGALDFSHVGLFGHSRAGEGIRAAQYFYLQPGSVWPGKIAAPVTFDGLFEIGGNDGQTNVVLDALGTPWHQILPACDGDNFTLPGVRPFDRMIAATSESFLSPKSYSLIRGSNHAFYSTEWQISDASGCNGGNNTPIFDPLGYESQAERDVGMSLFMAFFRGHVPSPVAGALNPAFPTIFDPLYDVTPGLAAITQVDRSYTSSPDQSITVTLDNMTSSIAMASNVGVAYGTIPRHAPGLNAAQVRWNKPSPNTFFQRNWAPSGFGQNLSQDRAIELRLSKVDTPRNPPGTANFSIQLVDGSGAMTNALSLTSYLALNDTPVGPTGLAHMTLRTLRIPISDFTGIALTNVRGIRFTFNQTPTGAIYIASIRRRLGAGAAATYPYDGAAPEGSVPKGISGETEDFRPTAFEHVARVRQAAALEADLGPGSEPYQGGMSIEVESDEAFPVGGALLVLRVAAQTIRMSRFPDGRDLRRLEFMLTREEAASLLDGEAMRVDLGEDSPVSWDAGRFDASWGKN